MTARRLPLLLVVVYTMLAAFLASYALAIVEFYTPGPLPSTAGHLLWWLTAAAFFVLLGATRAKIVRR